MKFLENVKNELIKVKWLNKKQIMSQFIIVNVVSFLILIYFGAIDFAIVELKELFK